MIVNKYGNGSGGGVTPEQVEQEIQSALTPYWESGITKEYVDSADTIIYASATSRMDDVEEVVSSALNEFHTQILEVSAATAGKADAANVSGRSTGYYFPYYNAQGVITGDTKAYKETWIINISNAQRFSAPLFRGDNFGFTHIYVASEPGVAGQIAKSDGHGFTWADDIYTPTSGFCTINGSAITNGGNLVIEGGDVMAIQEQVDEIDEVVSQALVDLNERVDAISAATPDLSAFWTSAQTQTAITTATQNMVTSTSVSTIWKGTQAQYDAIITKDPNTFYIIVNN